MSSLSAEQLEKIERNRTLALLRKKKAADRVNENSTSVVKVSNGRDLKDQHLQRTFSSNSGTATSSTSTTMPSAVCRLIPDGRFIVDMPYHGPSVEIFKLIPGRMYDPKAKRWSFPISVHDHLITKLKEIVTISGLPKTILATFERSDEKPTHVDLSKIDKTLLDSILPFQEEGIRFGISKKGRCLIADDMGLGKTIQALGIAHYYKENWPLIILCPSSMRFQWEEAIQTYLPSVNPFHVTVMTSSKDLINEAEIVISSYDLLKKTMPHLNKKNFGVVIMDESHSLKSVKAARTKFALDLATKCKNVILLSGTPALSRPNELYSQISAIDPSCFPSYFEFGMRYCDGKKALFGWDFSGSSNMEELELILKRIMIRRTKGDVITQLPSKIRKVIVLNPNMVQGVAKQMKAFMNTLKNQKEGEKKQTLFSFYKLTGEAKTGAVCEYIVEKLENASKMLVFAHHMSVMDEICKRLVNENVHHIRIDGSTSSEMRKVHCDTFQNQEDCRVAVLSLKAANSGITLTAAHLVLFAELYWNPGELTQAEDRAHRIGQRDSVLVEYLVAKGTVDEQIWDLVQSKLTTLNKVGLTKENFKEIDTQHLLKENQLKLTSMLPILPQTNTFVKSEFEGSDLFTESLPDEMDDDDIFQNIQLEEIENQYNLENKKRKTTEEDT